MKIFKKKMNVFAVAIVVTALAVLRFASCSHLFENYVPRNSGGGRSATTSTDILGVKDIKLSEEANLKEALLKAGFIDESGNFIDAKKPQSTDSNKPDFAGVYIKNPDGTTKYVPVTNNTIANMEQIAVKEGVQITPVFKGTGEKIVAVSINANKQTIAVPVPLDADSKATLNAVQTAINEQKIALDLTGKSANNPKCEDSSYKYVGMATSAEATTAIGNDEKTPFTDSSVLTPVFQKEVTSKIDLGNGPVNVTKTVTYGNEASKKSSVEDLLKAASGTNAVPADPTPADSNMKFDGWTVTKPDGTTEHVASDKISSTQVPVGSSIAPSFVEKGITSVTVSLPVPGSSTPVTVVLKVKEGTTEVTWKDIKDAGGAAITSPTAPDGKTGFTPEWQTSDGSAPTDETKIQISDGSGVKLVWKKTIKYTVRGINLTGDTQKEHTISFDMVDLKEKATGSQIKDAISKLAQADLPSTAGAVNGTDGAAISGVKFVSYAVAGGADIADSTEYDTSSVIVPKLELTFTVKEGTFTSKVQTTVITDTTKEFGSSTNNITKTGKTATFTANKIEGKTLAQIIRKAVGDTTDTFVPKAIEDAYAGDYKWTVTSGGTTKTVANSSLGSDTTKFAPGSEAVSTLSRKVTFTFEFNGTYSFSEEINPYVEPTTKVVQDTKAAFVDIKEKAEEGKPSLATPTQGTNVFKGWVMKGTTTLAVNHFEGFNTNQAFTALFEFDYANPANNQYAKEARAGDILLSNGQLATKEDLAKAKEAGLEPVGIVFYNPAKETVEQNKNEKISNVLTVSLYSSSNTMMWQKNENNDKYIIIKDLLLRNKTDGNVPNTGVVADINVSEWDGALDGNKFRWKEIEAKITGATSKTPAENGYFTFINEEAAGEKFPAFHWAAQYSVDGSDKGEWWLPSLIECKLLDLHKDDVNQSVTVADPDAKEGYATLKLDTSKEYWTCNQGNPTGEAKSGHPEGEAFKVKFGNNFYTTQKENPNQYAFAVKDIFLPTGKSLPGGETSVRYTPTASE